MLQYHRMSISPQQTCDDLLGLLEVFKRAIRDLAEQEGLTNIQVSALYMIYRQPTAVMGSIASKLHCDASNVTGIVDRLVAQGLVERRDNERDRRVKQLTVTERGQAVISKVMASLPDYLGCDRLSEDDRQALHRAVQKLSVS